MIKSNELRIGNFVKVVNAPSIYKGEEGIIQVEAITIHYSQYKDDIDLEPIPLTEQWLIDFGFEPFNKYLISRTFYNIGNMIIEIGGSGNHFAVYYGLNSELICFIEYVHQLQNIFFALIGQELEYKPKKL